ncbi:MAG: tRNA (guanine(46)-N(7))-methyltransferase TrmB [Roseinatronobacter sp.]
MSNLSRDDAPRNFYGRLKGKTLRPAQKTYLSEGLARYQLPGVSVEDNPERRLLDLPGLFGDSRPLWLEIGFGGGEHLVHQCRLRPDHGFIGCEPFINGVAMLLGKLHKAPVSNLRIHPWDVRELFDVLPDACLDRVYLLYPDPWPKARHHRRRFVTPDYLIPLARVMKPGAELRLATDIPDYLRQAMTEVPRAGFAPVSPGATDFSVPWEDWFSTRYEQKALRDGRKPAYMRYARSGAEVR